MAINNINGTLDRKLVEGAELVKIHGDMYPLRAGSHTVRGLSAHAGSDDLLHWAGNFESRPRMHVVHGETAAKQVFRERLEQELGLHAGVPKAGEILEL